LAELRKFPVGFLWGTASAAHQVEGGCHNCDWWRFEQQGGIVTHVIKVRVEDVNAQFERARSYGARVLEPPTEREYGERDCTLEDLAGHRWQFSQTLRDVAPEEYGCETVEPWPPRPVT